MTSEDMIRRYGLLARDLYEFNGTTDPIPLAGDLRHGNVWWDPDAYAAVFHIAGERLEFGDEWLDDIELVVADEDRELVGAASATSPRTKEHSRG